LDFFSLLVLFLVFSLAVTYVIKRKTSFETHYVITLIKGTKPLRVMKRLADKAGPLNSLATVFIYLGFGAIAADFLHGRKKSLKRRAVIFLASFAVLSVFFVLLDMLLGGIFSTSPLTRGMYPFFIIVFGISGFSGFTLFTLAIQASDILIKLFAGKKACPGVAPLLPGVELPNVPIVIPLHAWISLLIILVIHEGMHGITALRNRFRLRSTGIVLFGVLPIAAFVEPDEKELKKKELSSPKAALRFLAAGPGGNLAAMPVVLLLIAALSVPVALLFVPWQDDITARHMDGVYISGVDQNTSFCGDVYENPAYGSLDVNWAILAINGQEIKGLAGLQNELLKKRYKASAFRVEKPDGSIAEITLVPNELGSYGFRVSQKVKDADEIPQAYLLTSSAIAFAFDFFGWLFLLNFLMAIANFLPIVPFDGGRMARIIFAPYLPFGKGVEAKRELAGKILFALTIAIILLNMLPLFL
jgi:membrane-associated protease RseP (regulator of RpoE activity)